MIFTVDGPVATIRLDRPEQHNRIEPDDLAALAGHLETVNDDRGIRVLILASTGKSFSSGFHLGALAEGAPQRFEEVADALAACRVPTIAAIQGSVYGGAADLALACDFRIGVEGIELMVPAVRLGIPYYPSGIDRFLRRLAPNAAKRILLSAEKLDAAALLACGYLDELVAPASLEERVARLAAHLASLAPLAAQAIKAQLHHFDRDAAAEAVKLCLASVDHQEGLASWTQKRPPNFRGF